MGSHVYAVHVLKPDEIGAVEVIFRDEAEARAYATGRSTDHLVVSASVTRYSVDTPGTRSPVCWFREGKEQPVRFDRVGLYGC